MDEAEFEDIKKDYFYGGKNQKTTVRFFPDKSIATIIETTPGEEAIEVGVVEEGMTLEELEMYFPPRQKQGETEKTFNLAKIIRSVIYEAFIKEGMELEEGNVRNFWYTHLKKIITEILGLGESDTVLSSINESWGQMINSGLVNYEGMSIVGGKEDSRLSVVKDSPFSNLIVAVEKADYFHRYKWIPKLFNSTLITAGGQPSRTVARAFIRQLKELGVDLDQKFYMCTISDLDPAGYYIQDAFRKQFESAMRYYGGYGSVEIRRLFVRHDQVTDDLLRTQAMPCRDKAKSEKARKAENTKWEYFCNETDGGIFITKPDGTKVRALLEMNAFSKEVIETSIITELLKIIEETNDESKIMIPEIMRIFEEIKLVVSDSIFEDWKRRLIQPLIDRFLEDTNKWRRKINDTYSDNYDAISEKYDEQIKEQEQDARDQEPELHEQKDNLEIQISELEDQLSVVDDSIHEKCSDIFNEIDELENKKSEEISVEINKREYRRSKLEEFKDEKSTVFNPLEQELRRDILDFSKSPEMLFYFKDLEQLNRFKLHIGRLLTQPDLLLQHSQSCFDQPVNTFLETDLLHKASTVKDENVGSVRKAFPKVFTNEMNIYLTEIMQKQTFAVDVDQVEYTDLTDEVKESMDTTEESIDDGSWEDQPD